MSNMQTSKNNTSTHIDIIKVVKTPLGFFTLVVLVAEVIFGITASMSTGTDRTYLIVGMLFLIFILVIIVATLAFFRPEALLGKRSLMIEKSKIQYNIKFDSSINHQTFSGGIGNLDIDISGTYKVKPPSDSFRLFTKTFNPDVFWRQDPSSLYFDDSNKSWHGKISLWKEINSTSYSVEILALILDDSGKDMVLYADKVQRKTNTNVELDKLPCYVEKSNSEIKITRS